MNTLIEKYLGLKVTFAEVMSTTERFAKMIEDKITEYGLPDASTINFDTDNKIALAYLNARLSAFEYAEAVYCMENLTDEERQGLLALA